jgi:hypothetical protein
MLAAAAMLVVAGSAGAYLLVATAGVTLPYLAVSHAVPFGTALADADLTVVYVNAGAGLSPIPAGERASVVGKHAAVDLVPGTLLTRAQLADVALPGAGQQLVGIALKPAQLPVRTLRAGDAVTLVVIPATTLIGGDRPAPLDSPPTINATIAGSSASDTGGVVRVDVAVAAADGPTVAAMSAAGRIALVLTTRR